MSLATFKKGGIHPPYRKEISAKGEITPIKAPERVVVPLSQHIGAPCSPTVAIGDEVKIGQIVGIAEAFVSAPVHAPISGKVVALGEFPAPAGKMVNCVVIENDGQEQWVDLKEDEDYLSVPPDEMKKKISAAGIVGMGGAAFPTLVKLSPPKEKPIDTIILNGAECEPYLTADHRLMLERPGDIINGLKVLMKCLGVKKGFVGIESNKPDALETMTNAAVAAGSINNTSIEVYGLEVKYPQGAEKMLIAALTGREVPPRALPMDVGVLVQNVGTAAAVYEAVRYGRPLIERVVAVTGHGITRPGNYRVKVGTLISHLIEQCGGFRGRAAKVISGGPMMGFALYSLDVPVTKGTSGILVMDEAEAVHTGEFTACIRCGRCVEICPMGLMPSMLSVLSEAGFYEDTKAYNIFDCFECGSCAYVCPAKRPIVQFIRLAKSMVKP